MGGYVPYGYRYVPRDGEHRATLAIHEQEAALVRQMFDWLTKEELSCRRIATKLQELGVPTKNDSFTWRASTVNRILQQEVYTGVYYYRKAGQVEPQHRVRQAS